jgi:hypothetical protein
LRKNLESIPKPINAIEGDWLWEDGQKIKINRNVTCNSIKANVEFNNGTWKQSDNECVFILNWNIKKCTDVLELSPNFMNIAGYNNSGYQVKANRTNLKIGKL